MEFLLFILLFSVGSAVHDARFDNKIIDDPVVTCGDKEILVSLQTSDKFTGKIYVKGEYSNDHCSVQYHDGRISGGRGSGGGVRGREGRDDPLVVESGSIQRNFPDVIPLEMRKTLQEEICEPCVCPDRHRRQTENLEVSIPFDECHAERTRQMDPPALIVSFILMVSFHENFITKLDRAYNIRCAYQEADKMVHTELDVNSSPSPVEVTNKVNPPVCRYDLQSSDGISINSILHIGDFLRHRWICEDNSQGVYRLLVHSCFVEDSFGGQQQIIAEDGCSVDDYILATPTYSTTELSASVDAYAIKFPDQDYTSFRCSISLCLVNDSECEKQSPPKCTKEERNRNRRSVMNSSSALYVLHSDRLTILDEQRFTDDESSPETLQLFQLPSELCISTTTYTLVIALTTLLLTICSTKWIELLKQKG